VKDANSKTRTEMGIRTIDLDGSVEMNDSESLFVIHNTFFCKKSLCSKV
jgi:predicted secreted protein